MNHAGAAASEQVVVGERIELRGGTATGERGARRVASSGEQSRTLRGAAFLAPKRENANAVSKGDLMRYMLAVPSMPAK